MLERGGEWAHHAEESHCVEGVEGELQFGASRANSAHHGRDRDLPRQIQTYVETRSVLIADLFGSTVRLLTCSATFRVQGTVENLP